MLSLSFLFVPPIISSVIVNLWGKRGVHFCVLCNILFFSAGCLYLPISFLIYIHQREKRMWKSSAICFFFWE